MQALLLLLLAMAPCLASPPCSTLHSSSSPSSISSPPTSSSSLSLSFLSPSNSPLTMTIPMGTQLYGEPGSSHRIPISVSNTSPFPLHLELNYHEAFPVVNFQAFQAHVELVSDIQPRHLELAPGHRETAYLGVKVSSYAQPLYQSKVKVIAKQQAGRNQTKGLGMHREVSFHFTVVEQYKTLSIYDQRAPTCLLLCAGLCEDSQPGSCEEGVWRAQFSVQDNTTGLGWAEVVWPVGGEGVSLSRDPDWALGSTLPSVLHIQASCCLPGVAVSQTDLAGRRVTCRAGQVPSGAHSGLTTPLFLSLLAAATLLYQVN